MIQLLAPVLAALLPLAFVPLVIRLERAAQARSRDSIQPKPEKTADVIQWTVEQLLAKFDLSVEKRSRLERNLRPLVESEYNASVLYRTLIAEVVQAEAAPTMLSKDERERVHLELAKAHIQLNETRNSIRALKIVTGSAGDTQDPEFAIGEVSRPLVAEQLASEKIAAMPGEIEDLIRERL